MQSPRRDILKIVAFLIANLALGALITPWLYNAGKALVELTDGEQVSPVIRFLADAADRSEFPRFFDRSLLLAALVLLFPAIQWLRIGQPTGSFRDTPWSLRIPDALVTRTGQPLRLNPNGWRQGLIGALIGSASLLVLGRILVAAGWFHWRDSYDPLSAAADALLPSIAVPFIEEIIFRGVLLGIFLRAMRPSVAISSLAFLFAFMHFLKPPTGVMIPDPGSAMAGFHLLGQIFTRFGDPVPMISEFGTLLAVGLVLGYARWRTASLWLAGGLHSGWVFALIFFKDLTWPAGIQEGPARYLVGLTLRDGLVPTILVLSTGVLVHAIPIPNDRDRDVYD